MIKRSARISCTVTVPVCPGGVLVVSTTTSTERTRVTGGGPLASSIGRKLRDAARRGSRRSGPITSERYQRLAACPPSGSRNWTDTRIGRSADNRRRSHAAQLSTPTSDVTSAAYWLARAPGASV